jgi:4-hydroxybenzoate polyprenyltransferase
MTSRVPDALTSPRFPIALIRLLRPHQWIKNLLLFVPIALNHRQHDPPDVIPVALGFLAFCLGASAGYILNDWKDRESDRHHPLKCHRPLASGSVAPALAVALAALLLIAAFAVAILLPPGFPILLGLYLIVTALYSLWFKTRLLLDVFVLAGLYTLRLLAGGAAIDIQITAWLLAFSMFLFLSLAFAKRYAELHHAGTDAAKHLRARNYRQEDMAIILSAGPASGYLAVLVLAIYISSDWAHEHYRRPELLWLVCPILLYWITRVWFLARRGALTEDPVLFALKDRVSWIAGALTIALVATASVLP